MLREIYAGKWLEIRGFSAFLDKHIGYASS